MNWKRNLNRLWLAQSTSLLGLQVGALAVPLIAVEALHATATEVGLLAVASSLPWLILAPVVGGIADRGNRKSLLVISHLARAALWLTIPIAYLIGMLTLQQLLIVMVLVSILGMVFEITYRAFLPNVVPTEMLGAANGRMAATDSIARASGPALAGFLIQRFTAPLTIMVQAATTLVAALATLSMVHDDQRPDHRPPATSIAGWPRTIAKGFGYLFRVPALRWLTATETLYLLFFDMFFAMLVVFLNTTAGISAGLIGVIFSGGSLGGLVGAIIANRLRDRYGLDRVLPVAAVLRGAGMLAMPLSLAIEPDARLAVLIAARALNACSWTIYEVLADTYQQSVLPNEIRGSATAASLWLGRGAQVIGAAVSAALVAVIGLTPLLIIAGSGATLAGLVALAIRTTPRRS